MHLFAHLAKPSLLATHTAWNACQTERFIHTSRISLKQVLTRTMRIKGEEYYRRMDGVPKDYDMVYKFPMHYTLNAGKLVAVATTSIVPCAWLYNYVNEVPETQLQFMSSLSTNVSELWWFIAALAGTNFIVYRCCHIPALRIYRKDEDYIAMMPGLIPRFNHKYRFQRGQVKEHFGAKSFFQDLTYKINGKTVILVPNRFRTPTDLFEMLHDSDSSKYK